MKMIKKSLWLVMLLMILGGNKVWGDETVGNTDNSTGYGGAYSTVHNISSGQKLHLEFTNYSDKSDNWHNWLLYLSGISGLTNDFVLQADNWWVYGDNNPNNPFSGDLSGKIISFTSSIDWENFKNDMDGAEVKMDISYLGNYHVIIRATATNNGRVYTESLKLVSTSGFSAKLSVANSHLVITKAETTSCNLDFYDFTITSSLDSRFEATGNWQFGIKPGIYNYDSGWRHFTINNLNNGDQVVVVYQKWIDNGSTDYDAATFVTTNAKTPTGETVSNSTVLQSDVPYTMTADGSLTLNFHRYVEIKSIEINRTTGVTPAVSFSNTSFPNQKVGTDFAEPTLTVAPTGATAYYSSSNSTVATVDRTTGEVTLVGAGDVTITASVTVGGTTASASYNLTVLSPTATTYSFDFTGSTDDPEISSSGTVNVNGVTVKVLDFTDVAYGGKTFNHPRDQFGVVNDLTGDNKWYLHQANSLDGLYDKFGGNRDFYILDLHNGDRVSIIYSKIDQNAVSSLSSTNAKLLSGTWKLTASNDTVNYLVTEDGAMRLSIARNTYIHKINIIHDSATQSFKWSDANLDTKFDTSSGGKHLSYDLASLSFTEPTAIVKPSTATYTVKSLNTNVAIMNTNPDQFGDVLFVNTGSVNIQGRLKLYGIDSTDVYTVNVWADNASYEVSGNRCYMSEKGKLNDDNKTVTSIPGITMEFGSSEDATIIIEESGHLVAYTINKLSGWRHRYPYNSVAYPSVPTHGSFYKFTALANGTLSFKGVKNGGANSIVLLDYSNLSSPQEIFASGASGYCESGNITLTAGHTYYLYGNVPAENDPDGWSAFLLSEFTFESNFQLLDSHNREVSYGATLAGATSATDVVTIAGVANPVVTIEGYSGNISSATVSVSNGKLQVSNINGTGGAIRIKITDGGSSVRYFTLTVPYGAHTWDLRTGKNGQSLQEIVTNVKNNTANANLALNGLARVYKVASKSGGTWRTLKDPILTINGRVQGDNGFYFDKTSGLIFDTRSEGLGVKERTIECKMVTRKSPYELIGYYSNEGEIPDSLKNSYFSINNHTVTLTEHNKYNIGDETEYRFTHDVSKEADYMMMRGTSTIIIPGVTAGQYVKVYTYRHGGGSGETFKIKNLQDLDGTAYNSSTDIILHGISDGMSDNGITNCYGPAIFQVPTNYTATTDIDQMPAITLSDAGWAMVYKIEVCDDYSTDMVLSLNRGPWPEYIDVTPNCEHSSIVIRNNVPVTQQYSGVSGPIRVQNAETCTFTFERIEGDLSFTANTVVDGNYNLANVTYNSGHGLLKITQKVRKSGYTIDKNDFYIAVNTLTPQTYPYTWDFTNHNMFQGSSTTSTNLSAATADNYGKWTNSSGTYGAQFFGSQKPLFAHGSELRAGSNIIAETIGLGIEGASTTQSVVHTTSSSGDHTYYFKDYANVNGSITIDGNKLVGADTITIPTVTAGLYVFVKGNNLTGMTASNTSVPSIFNLQSDVQCFLVSETGDVKLGFPSNAQIERIAVTDVTKAINAYGYATEARSVAIDHTYTGEFTTDDVNAFYITSSDYNSETSVVSLRSTDVVPANGGVILYKEGASASCTVPLFYPAVNVRAGELTNNMLVGCTSATSLTTESDGYKNYILTNISKLVSSSEQATTGDIGFYQVQSSGGTIGANKAYLRIPTASGAKSCVFLMWDEWTPTHITQPSVSTEGSEQGENAVYYNLNGQRLQGAPMKCGIYIVNGKKVMVK